MKKNIDKIPEGHKCCDEKGTCYYLEQTYCHFMEQELEDDSHKICGLNETFTDEEVPPLTEEQVKELNKRIDDLKKWEKEGTLSNHVISHEELMKKLNDKYGLK